MSPEAYEEKINELLDRVQQLEVENLRLAQGLNGWKIKYKEMNDVCGATDMGRWANRLIEHMLHGGGLMLYGPKREAWIKANPPPVPVYFPKSSKEWLEFHERTITDCRKRGICRRPCTDTCRNWEDEARRNDGRGGW